MRIAYWLVTLMIATALPGSPQARASGTAIELQGKGFQVYTCAPSPGGFAWQLKAPDAALSDATGAVVGHHFAGPSWQANDGSTVVGEVLAASPAPSTGAIPWLVLRAKSHSGSGAFASVAYIARTATQGGVAPAAGCDGAHKDAETRIPYTATYVLFPSAVKAGAD
jgi:Protein of unknown function (DUF3455)